MYLRSRTQKSHKTSHSGKFGLKDESLVVNKDNKGISNIFVFVYTGRGGTKLAKVPPQNKMHELANKDCRFEPHAMVLQAGDTLKVTNPDDVGHNANLQFFNNKAENFVIPAKQHKEVVLTQAEPAVTEVACNIHPWMKAQVLVLDHPFAAITDKDGVVVIKGLPAGEKIVFRATHELGTFKNEIYVDGKKDKWKSNKFEVKIKEGMNDMGVVEVPAKEFK